MKKSVKKLLLWILIGILAFNFIMTTVYAVETQTGSSITQSAEAEEEKTMLDSVIGGVGFIIDGVVGIFLSLAKFIIIILGNIMQVVATGIAKLGGGGSLDLVTVDQILFNRLPIVDINFFDLNGASGAMAILRQGIAGWYYTLRNLSVVILLCILVYLGIRMALSTVASEKAVYKQMLIDWLVSFCIVFLIHYIILITISFSNGLVDIIANAREGDLAQNEVLFGSYMADMAISAATEVRFTVGMGYAIMYLLLVITTFGYLFAYIKRMITIGFLILIAPLISITYSVDKIKDNKSQALDTWVKEFVYNVLIQPFDCLIYIIFVGSAITVLNGTISGLFLAILMLWFRPKAIAIIRSMFGFEKSHTLGKDLVGMAATITVMNKAKSLFEGKVKSNAASGGKRSSTPQMKDRNYGEGNGSSGSGQTSSNIPPFPSGGGSGGTSSRTMNYSGTSSNSTGDATNNRYGESSRSENRTGNRYGGQTDTSDSRTSNAYEGENARSENRESRYYGSENGRAEGRTNKQDNKTGTEATRQEEISNRSNVQEASQSMPKQETETPTRIKTQEEQKQPEQPKKMPRILQNLAEKTVSANLAATGILFGATVGLAQSDITAAITGGIAGYSGQKGMKAGLEGMAQKRTVRNNERVLASEYEQYRRQTGYTDQEIEERASALAGMEVKEIQRADYLDEATKRFGSVIHDMKTSYESNGMKEKDAKKQIEKTVEKIQKGEIVSHKKELRRPRMK